LQFILSVNFIFFPRYPVGLRKAAAEVKRLTTGFFALAFAVEIWTKFGNWLRQHFSVQVSEDKFERVQKLHSPLVCAYRRKFWRRQNAEMLSVRQQPSSKNLQKYLYKGFGRKRAKGLHYHRLRLEKLKRQALTSPLPRRVRIVE